MNDELLDRLKKLQTLAERGVGGEKETAQKKFAKLLADNGMTEADLNEEKQYYYLFSYSGAPYRKRLLGQIIYKVTGYNNGEGCNIYRSKGTRNKYGIYCTPAQKIEIDLDYEFYCNLFDHEVDILMSAFIQKQELFPSDAPCDHISLEEMTQEERENYMRQKAYQGTISKRHRAFGMIEEK